MKKSKDKKRLIWEVIRPRGAGEWAATLLFLGVCWALGFGAGLWAGGFIW